MRNVIPGWTYDSVLDLNWHQSRNRDLHDCASAYRPLSKWWWGNTAIDRGLNYNQIDVDSFAVANNYVPSYGG